MFAPKSLKADYAAYNPAISAEIMEVHYTKHYIGYINNLNNALTKHPDFFDLEIPQILARLNELPEEIRTAVRNNGGGAANHEIFWEILSTNPTEIHEGALKEAVEKKFGSWEDFISQITDASLKIFGSGWAWLVIDNETSELKIMCTPNQDSPYMNECFPVLGIDVWEHAYYLQYKNVRKDYVQQLLTIIDWKAVEHRFLGAR